MPATVVFPHARTKNGFVSCSEDTATPANCSLLRLDTVNVAGTSVVRSLCRFNRRKHYSTRFPHVNVDDSLVLESACVGVRPTFRFSCCSPDGVPNSGVPLGDDVCVCACRFSFGFDRQASRPLARSSPVVLSMSPVVDVDYDWKSLRTEECVRGESHRCDPVCKW